MTVAFVSRRSPRKRATSRTIWPKGRGFRRLRPARMIRPPAIPPGIRIPRHSRFRAVPGPTTTGRMPGDDQARRKRVSGAEGAQLQGRRQPDFQSGKTVPPASGDELIDQFHDRLKGFRRPVGEQSPHNRLLDPPAAVPPARGSRSRSRRVGREGRQRHHRAIHVCRTNRAGRSGAAGRVNSTAPSGSLWASRAHSFSPVVVLRLCLDRISQSAGVPAGRRRRSTPADRLPDPPRAPAGSRARSRPDRRRSRNPRPSGCFP